MRLEAEAILTIIARVQDGRYTLIKGDILDLEISKIPDAERKKKVGLFANLATSAIHVDSMIIKRAKEIIKLGLKGFDAIHIACAENGKVDVFLTTDDEIIKKYTKNMQDFKVKIRNPLSWLAEVV
nr:PIN domain-containing protein [Candidatus Sigynarchaeota archaeon]